MGLIPMRLTLVQLPDVSMLMALMHTPMRVLVLRKTARLLYMRLRLPPMPLVPLLEQLLAMMALWVPPMTLVLLSVQLVALPHTPTPVFLSMRILVLRYRTRILVLRYRTRLLYMRLRMTPMTLVLYMVLMLDMRVRRMIAGRLMVLARRLSV